MAWRLLAAAQLMVNWKTENVDLERERKREGGSLVSWLRNAVC